jgi:hypothetical protein
MKLGRVHICAVTTSVYFDSISVNRNANIEPICTLKCKTAVVTRNKCWKTIPKICK